MTHYISHIYAEPKPEVLRILKQHPVLNRGLFHVPHLKHFKWPTNPQFWGGKRADHFKYPKDGLVVVRELTGPGPDTAHNDREASWLGSKGPIQWSEIHGPKSLKITLPPDLPVVSFGNVYAGDKYPYPPVEFLRYVKQLSVDTTSTVVFYRHLSGAESAWHQEYAWVFGQDECVYVSNGNKQYQKPLRYEGPWVSALEYSRYGAQILQFMLDHFNIKLSPSEYFPLHTRYFPWEEYRVKAALS
jgi:hypothetical protein